MRRLNSRFAIGVLLLATLLVSLPPPAAARADGLLANAINVAGRQRMLAERIIKSWCLLGLGNENRQPRAQLFNAIELYEEYLAELEAFLVDHPRIRPGLADLKRRWRPFERLASTEPSRGKAIALLRAGEQLVDASERLVRSLTALSGREEARMVALSGRQRMLTQKLVKTYGYMAWGFQQPGVVNQFVGTWGEFEAAHEELRQSAVNTPAVRSALDDASQEWAWFKSTLSLHRDDVFYPGIIDNAGENMLTQMERVTTLYESMLAQRSER